MCVLGDANSRDDSTYYLDCMQEGDMRGILESPVAFKRHAQLREEATHVGRGGFNGGLAPEGIKGLWRRRRRGGGTY